MSVALPRDGAGYSCTWIFQGERCDKTATRGLSIESYARVHSILPSHALVMRALCHHHLTWVETMLKLEED
jgi:hypothetical protein